MTDCEKQQEFPLEHFIDKAACNQDKFLERFPEYDGRGTVIAVMDTGIDPDLYSMKVTPTGERKLVDLINCSGENDVDTSILKTATDGILEGLTGRKLKIPDDWTNASNEYHVGMKPIFELFQSSVKKRVEESRGKGYKSSHAQAVSGTSEKLQKHVKNKGKTSEELADKFKRNDIFEEAEFLKKMKDVEDLGPVADVIVWKDGENWKAVLDTSYCGDLSKCTVMSSFRVDGEYSKISGEDQLSYSFRIASDGNWVQIVVPKCSHGSKVADIAAGYYPDEPKRNGLAPGAKVISIALPRTWKSTDFGDLIEALNICKEKKVEVINLSYQLPYKIENYGRFLTELTDLAYKNNIIIVKSAGNSGPGLSTVDAVSALDATIDVASYMTKNLHETVYSAFSSNDGYVRDYSSRGPSPFPYVHRVPQWPVCLDRNFPVASTGTSFSSPYVAGVVACLLSGLKIQQKQWSPYLVKQALENTAKSDSDDFCRLSNGQGLVQMCEAFNYLDSLDNDDSLANAFRLQVILNNEKNKGIYIRTKNEQKVTKHKIGVLAEFPQTSEGNFHQLKFQKKFRLSSDREWIKTPEHFVLAGAKHTFDAKIDYSAVREGEVVYSEIVGIDSANAAMGPLFRVPVTIINPIEVTKDTNFAHEFTASVSSVTPYRRFIEVPPHANLMTLNVRTETVPAGDNLSVYVIQMGQHKYTARMERSFKLAKNETESYERTVSPGETLEICLTHDGIDNLNDIPIDIRVTFKGVWTNSSIIMKHSAHTTKVCVDTKAFTHLCFRPEITLNKVVVPLKVTESKIEAHDNLGDTKSHRLSLAYKMELKDRCTVALAIENSIKPQILDVGFMVFDSNNFYVNLNECCNRLDKGNYTIRAQILHEDIAVLKTLTGMILNATVTLETEIKMNAFALPGIQFMGDLDEFRDRLTVAEIMPNSQKIFYFRHTTSLMVPTYKFLSFSAGSYLGGHLYLGGLWVDVEYFLDECTYVPEEKHELSYESTAAKKSDVEEYKGMLCHSLDTSVYLIKSGGLNQENYGACRQYGPLNIQLTESVRKAAIDCFVKCPIPDKKSELYKKLMSKYPNDIALHVEQLTVLAKKEFNSETKTARLEVIQRIMDLCNPEKVQKFFGLTNTYGDKRVKDEMERYKSAIVETLKKKFTFCVDEFLLSKDDVVSYFKAEPKKISATSAENKTEPELVKQILDSSATPDSVEATEIASSTATTSEVSTNENKTEPDLIKPESVCSETPDLEMASETALSTDIAPEVTSAKNIAEQKTVLETVKAELLSSDTPDSEVATDTALSTDIAPETITDENKTEIELVKPELISSVTPDSGKATEATSSTAATSEVTSDENKTELEIEQKSVKPELVRSDTLDSGISSRAASPTAALPIPDEPVVTLKDVDNCYIELLNWAKEDDSMNLLSAKHAVAHGHYGRALSHLTKYVKYEKESGRPTKKEEEAMAEICEKLKWTHIADRIRSNILVKNPGSCKAFKGNHCLFD